MTGQKRSADDTQHTTRSSKAAKANSTASPAKPGRGSKRASKAPLAASAFKNSALPVHATITHTPPSVEKEEADSLDVGAIGTVTLTPTAFSTGSYGWKGSKRMTIELQASENAEGKEKVSVMLTINATVMGSKQAKEDDETQGNEPTAEVATEAQKPKDDDQDDAENAKPNGE